MKEFTSKEGPQTGGILKIFAESLKPEIPYKTILASVRDNADVVTKAALEKFLLSKEDPFEYCIVMAIVPLGDSSLENAKERVIRSSDCPLAIQNSWPKNKGHITFHLRRRVQGSDPAPPPREPTRDREIKNKSGDAPRQPPPPIE
jgi:afadin